MFDGRLGPQYRLRQPAVPPLATDLTGPIEGLGGHHGPAQAELRVKVLVALPVWFAPIGSDTVAEPRSPSGT